MVSKVFECCVHNQMISHISSQLHHLQFGFLRGKSTTSQLLHILQEFHKALESRSRLILFICTLRKRSTRLAIIFCWVNFKSLVQRLSVWTVPKTNSPWRDLKYTPCLVWSSTKVNFGSLPFSSLCERFFRFHLRSINYGDVC